MKQWKRTLASMLCISMLFNLAAPAYGGSLDVPIQRPLEKTATSSDMDDEGFDEFGDGDLIDDLENATNSDADEAGDDEDLATPADWLDIELLGATPANWRSVGGNNIILNDNYGNALPMHIGDTYELEITENHNNNLFFVSNDIYTITVDEYGVIEATGIGEAEVAVYQSEGAPIATMQIEVVDSKVEIHTVKLYGNGGTFDNGEDYMEIRGAYNQGGYNTEYDFPTASQDGKVFKGWYSEPEGGVLENSGWWSTISRSYTAYANWEAQQFWVRFMDGDQILTSVKVNYGETVQKISDPYKDGYYFSGWTVNGYGTQVPYDFTKPVVEELNIYASWETAKSIKNAEITINGTYQYTGEEIKPEVVVKDGDKILQKDVDYTISGDTGLINAGDYTISVHGINKYDDWVSVPFSIAARPITDAVITIDGRYTYTGYRIYPEVTVLLDGKKIAELWNTYSVSGYGKEVGEASVTVNGAGNFTGSKEVSFTILPKLPEDRSIKILNRNGGYEIPVHVGDTYRIEVEVEPADYAQYVSFESRDESVVKVDENGLVTAVGVGNTYVYAKVNWDSTYSSDQYVTFRVVDEAQKVVNLEIDANGGTFQDGTTKWSRIVKAGDTVWGLESPTHSDKLFGGWYRDAEGTDLVTTGSYYAPDEDMVLYAGWKDTYKIRFDYNGVSWDKESEKEYLIEAGQTISYHKPSVPDNIPETYHKLFVGWKTESGEVLDSNGVYNYTPKGNETLTAEWTTEFYTVKFDYNGVTYYDKNSETYYIQPGKKISSYPSFPSEPNQTEGKLFEYWMDEAGNKIDSIYNYVPEGDVTITAKWCDHYYTIKFDYNDEALYPGSMERYKYSYVIPGDTVNGVPGFAGNPSPTAGKKFLGWQNADGVLFTGYEINDYVPSRSEVITAQWSDYYTVTYDTNGGTFSYGNNVEYVTVGQPISSKPDPVKEGFVFAGWFEKESGSYIENQYYIPTGDVTLVARWEEYWTITYDANGGTYTYDSYKSDTVVKGEQLYLNGSYGYQKDGSILLGWCKDKACEGEVLTGNYCPASDITLYAKWAEKCTVTLEAGDGYFAGGKKTATMETAFGEPVSYMTTVYNDNATLDGWYTKDGTRWTQAYIVTRNETFYAKWLNTNLHKVTFHAGGPYLYDAKTQQANKNTVVMMVEDGYAIGSISDMRNSYECIWYLDQTFKTPFNLSTPVEQDLDLYAKWFKRISVSWDANGGKDTSGRARGNILVRQGEATDLPDVFKEGYVFEGWYTSDGRQLKDQDYIYENVSVAARWRDGYKITLNLDGGKLYNTGYYPETFYVKPGEKCKYYPDPVRDDAAFLGWYDEAGNQIWSISSYTPVKDTVINAKWTTDMVRVRVHSGGSSLYDAYTGKYTTVQIYNVARGKSITGNTYLTKPEKMGLNRCIGWSLTEGGTEAIDETTYIFTADSDLYPIWGETWAISFDYMGGFQNNGSSGRNISYVTKGQPLKSPQDRDMKKAGYIFDGWYENTDYTGTKYEIPFTPERNMMLYAKWIEDNAVKHTVTFDAMGGSEIAPQLVAQGQSAQEPEQPKKSGSVFLGWFTEKQYWNRYQFNEIVYKDITLYAKWMETTDVNDATVKIKGTYTYTGEVIVPELTVTMGMFTLVEGTDYTVSGENTEAGTAEITIKGIGDYTGERKVTFTIEQAEMEVEAPQGPLNTTYSSTATLADLNITAPWQWDEPKQKIGDVGTHSYGITYPASSANYKDKHAQMEVKVEPLSIEGAEISFKQAVFTYTGNPIEPMIASVIVRGEKVPPASGYKATYANNTNAGEATVTVEGIGNFTGTATKTFTIGKADPELSIGNDPYEVIYGQKLSDITLPRGWSWQNPDTEVGDVTGTGSRTFPADFKTYEGCNYGDKTGAKLKVRVLPRTIMASDVELNPTSVIYDGTEKTVTVTVTSAGKVLAAGSGKDYTVSYKNNIEVGTAAVTVTGVHNYGGTVTKYFEIIPDPYAIEYASIQLKPDVADYTGERITPETTVTLAGVTLELDTHYTVAYGENTEPGTGTVTVTGLSPYHGEKEVSFMIRPSEELVLRATYGDLLENVELPAGWSWKNPEESVGDVTGTGTRGFLAVFTEDPEAPEYEFQVMVLPKDIEQTKITVNGEDIVYIPDVPAEPEVIVVDEALAQTLAENEDYEVTYSENDHAGNAFIKIAGKGNYSGSVERTFVIQKAEPDTDITGDKLEGKLDKENKKMNLSIKDEPFFLYVSYAGDGEITFTSADDSIFKIEKTYNDFLEADDGKLTVNGIGKATLTITVSETQNYKGAELVYDVIVSPVTISSTDIRLDQDAYEYTGSQIKPEFSVVVNGVTLTAGTDYTVSYGDNLSAGKEAGTVTVTGTGDYTGIVTAVFEITKAENPAELPDAVEAVYGQKLEDLTLPDGWAWKEPSSYVGNAGEQSHEVVLAETDNYKEKTGNVTVQVARKDLTEAMVTLAYEETVYDGTKKEPAVTVTDGELAAETDYTTAYRENQNAGTATVTVTGQNNYQGQVEKQFTIQKATIQETDVVIEGKYIYDGTQQTPEPVVTVGEVTLLKDTDYTVTYGENVNAGSEAGSLTVTGQGNYTGRAEKTFEIEKAESLATPPNAVQAVYGQKLNEITLEEGWQWNDPDAYVGDAGTQEHDALYPETENYKEKAAAVEVEVAKKALTDSMVALEYTETEYNGSAKEPAVTVTDGELNTEGSYDVAYQDNLERGTAVVTVTGKKNYEGEVTKHFTITKAVIKEEHIAISGSYTYDGTQQIPEITVTVGGRVLTAETDYETAFGENIHAGDEAGTVTVTGTGNYTGTAAKTFAIQKAVNPTEEPGEIQAVYGQKLEQITLPDGWKWRNPDASVGNAGRNELVIFLPETMDYLEKAGKAVITVTPKELSGSMVTVENATFIYDGAEKQPEVTVKDAVTLTGREYQVGYEDNIHAGTAKVIVTGTGNYRGTVQKTFTIRKATPSITVENGLEIRAYLQTGTLALRAECSNQGELSYTSSNEAVATVDADGTVTMHTTGEAVITVSYAGNEDYTTASVEVKLTVTRRSSGGSSSGGSSSGSGSSGGGAKGGTAAYTSVPEGYTGPTKVIGSVEVPSYVEEGTWTQDAEGNWKFTGSDGTSKAGQWVAAYNPYADLNGGQAGFDWFIFDEKGNMVTGWYTDALGDTYYLNPASDNTKGRMVTGWYLIDGMYYYFNENPDGRRGKLLKSAEKPE